MMPLTLVAKGETAVILRVEGDEEVRRHLAELGFVVGAPVSVISKLRGNVIVGVKDSRVAISRELAKNLLV